MTWLAQIPHVMAKDIRQARWPLAGYALVVTVTWLTAWLWPTTVAEGFDFTMPLVVIAGMFVAGVLIQTDSPIRGDAFWASRPLYPTAVLVAKVALTLSLIIGAPVVAQLHVLLANGIPVGEAALMALRSVWVYGLWLLMAVTIAAITSDLRSFTLGLVLIPVGILLLMMFSEIVVGGQFASPPSLFTIVSGWMAVAVGVGAALWLLVVLYRTRSLGIAQRAVSGVAIVGTFFALGARPPARAVAAASGDRIDDAKLVIIQESDPSGPVMLLSNENSTGKQTSMLESWTVLLHLRDRTTIRVSMDGNRFVVRSARMPLADSIRWTQQWTEPNNRVQLRLTSRQREAVRAGIDSASVEGTLVEYEPSVGLSVPFRAGAATSERGMRVQITKTYPLGDDTLATVVASAIDRSGSSGLTASSPWLWDRPRYALVNKARSEAALAPGTMNGGSNSAIILPGAWRSFERIRLVSVIPPTERGFTEDWVAGADLVRFEWTERSRGRVRISARLR